MRSIVVLDCKDSVSKLLLEFEDTCWLFAEAGVLEDIELKDVRMGSGASKLST